MLTHSLNCNLLSSEELHEHFVDWRPGYIGSHTAHVLARSGHQPVTIDNLSTGHRSNVKWGPLVEGDVADPALLRTTFRDHAIETVIHFAANAYVGESVENPKSISPTAMRRRLLCWARCWIPA
jgi:UDP-glucose 4-epimerase